MEQNEKLRALETLQKKLYAYNCASNSLYLDAVTVAPKNTAEGRGVALSILAGELQKLMTAPETLALVEELYARRETLDTLHRREVEELRRSCRQLTRIPAEEYMAYSELTNRASDVWHKAKEENDFASFCPILQELVEYNRKFAGYYDAEKAPYDALLNEYERGVDTQQLDVFFDTLREGLVPLIRAIGEKPQIDDSFLHLEYPVEQQKAFADYLMGVMGLDRGHCGLGETEHPFTLEFNNKDVRITTNYDLHNVASSMYSVLHEGGHALYELGAVHLPDRRCVHGRAREPVPLLREPHRPFPRLYRGHLSQGAGILPRTAGKCDCRAVLPRREQGGAQPHPHRVR